MKIGTWVEAISAVLHLGIAAFFKKKKNIGNGAALASLKRIFFPLARPSRRVTCEQK